MGSMGMVLFWLGLFRQVEILRGMVYFDCWWGQGVFVLVK
jgi:hypothetical protein